ncbi:5-hydroxytryptamine receptor [Caerostris darwini]|uniref:5-hydroxytryptamine receptor n=1 Tax=Caerostris darwini TaxID=1538125 RepID=A0AAV4SIQ7_9ARAC|nr:5-hydroxytryptamine receptor [Caerostris darwini]
MFFPRTEGVFFSRCLLSQDMGYQIFATCATFYAPLVIILILYWRIYLVARGRIRRRPVRPAALLPLVSQGVTSFNESLKTVSFFAAVPYRVNFKERLLHNLVQFL